MKKALLFLALLTGCQLTPPDNYNQQLAQWLGQTQWALFRKWGQPDEQYALDMDTYIVVYNKNFKHPVRHQKYPYKSVMNYPALAGPRYGYSQYPQNWYCQTTFTLRYNIVADYSFSGDDCI